MAAFFVSYFQSFSFSYIYDFISNTLLKFSIHLLWGQYMYWGLLGFSAIDLLFTHPVFPKSRHNQMFLFLLRDPWQAHDTGHCCSCTFLYIIDDSELSRRHQSTSNIDYHTVRSFRSFNFPFLNRKNKNKKFLA